MRPADGRCAQLTRRLALDRNELRRTSDRIEAWAALALIVAFVPLAVLAAVCAVSWAHASAVKESRGEPLKQVTAVLLHSAPAGNADVPGSALFSVPARWTVAGSAHVGDVQVIPGTPAGTGVRIWVNRAGKVQPPRPTAAQLSARVAVAAVTAPLGVAFGLWLAWLVLRWVLDRRRLASWADAWSSFGPSRTR